LDLEFGGWLVNLDFGWLNLVEFELDLVEFS
jgi:hypothetical protein